MGRGRVQLKRIENKINRQVTFSKRRSSLLKKASEISVLCDADVALIVFSSQGKLAEYSNDSSMEQILDRYERSYAETQLTGKTPESQGSWSLEHAKLQARLNNLQKDQRHFMGEDIDALSIKETLNLEHQIYVALKQVKSRKNQLMLQSISELQKQDRTLQMENNLLAKKIKSEEEKRERDQVEQQNAYTDSPTSGVQSQERLDLNICSIQEENNGEADAEEISHPNTNAALPSWMFQHATSR